jgi:hypothetical protein
MVKRSAGPAREQTQRMVIRLSAPRFVRLSDPERPGEVASSIEVISSPYAMDFRSRRARCMVLARTSAKAAWRSLNGGSAMP